MIDISGDVIYFQGKAVGIITVPNGSLRGDFEESLDSHVDIKEEIESIMEDYTPREDIQEFFSDIASGELNMSDEIDNMCKKLSAIYELKCWWRYMLNPLNFRPFNTLKRRVELLRGAK